MEDLLAARAQMALSLGFHIIFAAIGMAMPFLMAVSHYRWIRTGKRVYLDFDGRSLKSQMRLADKLKAKGVLIIGDEELKSGTLVLREMATKEQRNVREEDLA